MGFEPEVDLAYVVAIHCLEHKLINTASHSETGLFSFKRCFAAAKHDYPEKYPIQ